MVMRQRAGGRPTTSRPRLAMSNQNFQYFQPTYEWKQEEDRAVLLVHLPGFTKEQLAVQLQSTDKLRVRGTRPARANTYIRFDQTYPIPEDSTSTGLQAKFEGGILYVTFQKREKKKEEDNITNPQIVASMEEVKDSTPPPKPKAETVPPTAAGDPKPVEAPKEVKSQMDEENDGRQSVSSITEAKTATEAPPAKLIKSPEEEEKEEEDESTGVGRAKTAEAALSSEKEVSNKPADHQAEKAAKAGEEIGERDRDDDVKKKPKALDEKQTEMNKESKSSVAEKNLDQKQTEEGIRTEKNKKKMDEESKMTAENVNDEKMRLEKEKNIDESANGHTVDQKGVITKNGVEGGYTYEKYKQIVKDLIKTPTDAEERKLLMNIGVAVLVIAALGAYLTYSRWSSGRSRSQ